MLICYENSYEIAKLLIEKGADVEARDKEEWTAIIWASCENSLEVAQLLIEADVDIDTKSKEDKDAIDYCRTRKMLNILIQAKINQKVN